MTDSTISPAGPPSVSAAAFIATFGIALVMIVLFLLLDTALARIDRRESQRHAADLYAEGRALLTSGDASAARERFASAVAIERGNSTYALGLAQAMIADGRVEDAERALNALLDRAANSGPVNLVMARLLAQTGRGAEATMYFHRAIFGRWNADSTARRTEARFELIERLAAQHDERAMLGELLPLEASFPDSAPLQRRLAHLFLRAGAPGRAVSILREMIREDPRDGDAYAGLGEAALALGNFVTARADLVQAMRLRPNDQAIAERLAVADDILALDPENRRLSASERATRAHRLLERTLADVARCGRPGDAATVVDSARVALSGGVGSRRAAPPEQLTRLAVALGPSIRGRCADRGRPDEVVTLLLRTLDQ